MQNLSAHSKPTMCGEPFGAEAALPHLKIAIESFIGVIIRNIKPEISQDRDAVTNVGYRQQLLSLGVDMSELIRIVHFVWLDRIPPSRRSSLDRDVLECEEWVHGLLKHGTVDGREEGLHWTSYAGLDRLKMGIERHSVKLWPYLCNTKASGHPVLGRFPPSYSGPMNVMPPQPIPPREEGGSPWFDYGGCRYLRPQPFTPPNTRPAVASGETVEESDMEWEPTVRWCMDPYVKVWQLTSPGMISCE